MSDHRDELVLLIHGTFAAPEEGTLRWWQKGSGPWKEIEKRLPKGTRLDDAEDVFQWSGMNLERDRYKAGRGLFERLVTLEQEGRPYHLVGHSHGGSVIWHALQESIRRSIGKKRPDPHHELTNLRSWTTVGTPFLQYNESAMGRWRGALVTFLLLVVSPALTVLLIGGLYTLLETIFEKLPVSFKLEDSPVLSVGAGVIFFILATIAGLALYFWASAIRREALFIRQAVLVRHEAMLVFGRRWLGIRSREDEAINGLKSSVKLDFQLFPRFDFRSDRVFVYDRRIYTYRLLLKTLVKPFLNWIFVPFGNNFILAMLSKSAQGDDRPGCCITSVSEGPICLQGQYRYPSMPPSEDDALVAAANANLIERAPELVPKVRTMLADFSSGIAMLGGAAGDSHIELVGNELVHTSYFDSEFVLDLIAHHIQVHERDITDMRPSSASLTEWYEAVGQDVRRDVIESPLVRKRSLTHLASRNWPAFCSVFCGVLAPLCLLAVVIVTIALADSRSELGTGQSFGLLGGLVGALAILFGSIILGRIGQYRAERGARFRRIAMLGTSLGVFWLAIIVLAPTLVWLQARSMNKTMERASQTASTPGTEESP